MIVRTIWLATALCLSIGCMHGARRSVGTWDTEDIQTASRAGQAVPDPPSLTVAKGYETTLASGIQVEMIALSKEESGPKEQGFSINDRSWAPSGAPYVGEVLRRSDGVGRDFDKEYAGQRFIAFRITAPTRASVEVIGYVSGARAGVPQPELHGRDLPTHLGLYPQYSQLYRPAIVVEDKAADRYLFGVASGEWKEVTKFAWKPTELATKTLAEGPWGTLKMIAPPRETGPSISKTLPPVVSFQALPPDEPVLNSYRIRLFDRQGEETANEYFGYEAGIVRLPVTSVSKLGLIVVEARPYAYVAFKGVHFDPDPELWGETYWGAEGNRLIQDHGGVIQFVAILRPQTEEPDWRPAESFATDGKRWREFPDPDATLPRFSISDWPPGEMLAGLFRLTGEFEALHRNVRVEVFSATSGTAGKGLETKLKSPFLIQFDRDPAQVLFSRPETPFVQFKVALSDSDWKKAGAAPPPTVQLVQFSQRDKELIKSGVNVGISAITVILRATGSMDFFYHTPNEPNNLDQGLVTWQPEGSQVRLRALLKNGSRAVLQNNGVSDKGDVEYIFNLNGDSEPVLDAHPTHVFLKDISLFEVEVRGYGNPFYFSAQLPPR